MQIEVYCFSWLIFSNTNWSDISPWPLMEGEGPLVICRLLAEANCTLWRCENEKRLIWRLSQRAITISWLRSGQEQRPWKLNLRLELPAVGKAPLIKRVPGGPGLTARWPVSARKKWVPVAGWIFRPTSAAHKKKNDFFFFSFFLERLSGTCIRSRACWSHQLTAECDQMIPPGSATRRSCSWAGFDSWEAVLVSVVCVCVCGGKGS